MSKPKMLLLDEPSMGLAQMLVDEVLETVKMLHDTGLTILLVEQNARAALNVAEEHWYRNRTHREGGLCKSAHGRSGSEGGILGRRLAAHITHADR